MTSSVRFFHQLKKLFFQCLSVIYVALGSPKIDMVPKKLKSSLILLLFSEEEYRVQNLDKQTSFHNLYGINKVACI